MSNNCGCYETKMRFLKLLLWFDYLANILTETFFIITANTLFGLSYALYMLWEGRNMLKKLKGECENQNRWRDTESILKVAKHFTRLTSLLSVEVYGAGERVDKEYFFKSCMKLC